VPSGFGRASVSIIKFTEVPSGFGRASVSIIKFTEGPSGDRQKPENEIVFIKFFSFYYMVTYPEKHRSEFDKSKKLNGSSSAKNCYTKYFLNRHRNFSKFSMKKNLAKIDFVSSKSRHYSLRFNNIFHRHCGRSDKLVTYPEKHRSEFDSSAKINGSSTAKNCYAKYFLNVTEMFTQQEIFKLKLFYPSCPSFMELYCSIELCSKINLGRTIISHIKILNNFKRFKNCMNFKGYFNSCVEKESGAGKARILEAVKENCEIKNIKLKLYIIFERYQKPSKKLATKQSELFNETVHCLISSRYSTDPYEYSRCKNDKTMKYAGSKLILHLKTMRNFFSKADLDGNWGNSKEYG
jgi:hypothetical protein